MTAPPRRISSVPVPLPGESLFSWVVAVADKFEITVLRAMDALGLKAAARTLSTLMIDLPDPVVANLIAATGLDLRSLRAMTLFDPGRLIAGEFDETTSYRAHLLWAREAQVSYGHSNFCPQCLVENGHRWLLQWRLPWHFICGKHGTFLVSRCPRCGGRPQWQHRAPHRHLCTNTGYVGLGQQRVDVVALPRAGHLADVRSFGCGAAFADAPAAVVADPRLLDNQMRIIELERQAATTKAGRPDPSPLTLVLYLASMTAAAGAWRLVETSDAEVTKMVDRYHKATKWRTDKMERSFREWPGPEKLRLVEEPLLMAAAVQVALRAVDMEVPAALEWFTDAALSTARPPELLPISQGPRHPRSALLFRLWGRDPWSPGWLEQLLAGSATPSGTATWTDSPSGEL